MFNINNTVVILYGTRFPENVGMVARACANLGCRHLRLVKPERYDEFRAWPLATRIGYSILHNIQIFAELTEATADLYALFGTSARLGGRRKAITLSCFSQHILENNLCASEDKLFGILFGPEDRGLSNAELSLCQELINIPARPGAASFNIAQSVLLILYEIYKNSLKTNPKISHKKQSERITIGDLQRLETELKDLMLLCSALPQENSDYFFAQWHNMLSRLELKRHEYDALMGLCRQLKRKITF